MIGIRTTPRVPVAVAVVVALSLMVGLGGCSKDSAQLRVVSADSGEFDYEYRIPPGTGERVADGEDVEIVPQVLEVEVGERIRVINDDERGAAVGIFWIPAGGRAAMEFTTAGTLTGECDVHPSGEFTINVT